jgi:hypothetical protein
MAKLVTPRKVWAVLAPDGHIRQLDQDEQWMRDNAAADHTVVHYVAPASAWGLFLAARAAILRECFQKGMTAEEAARQVACDPMQAQLIAQTDMSTSPYSDAIAPGEVLPAATRAGKAG